VFNVQQFTDAGGPLANGRLYTYTYGTTTLKTAYTDAAGSVPHTYTSDGLGGQYIALNSRGELPAPLYLTTGSYDIALKRADGSSVWTRRADPGADASALFLPLTGGTISGALSVTGTATLAAVSSSSVTTSGTLSVGGATTVAGLTAGSASVTDLTSAGKVIIATSGSPYFQSQDNFGGGHTYVWGSGGSNFASGTFGIVDSTAAATRWSIDSSGHMAPGADNTQNCGTAAKRWAVVYAGTGAINTSDARVKTPVQTLTNAEVCAAVALSREIGTFRFLDAVAAKGDRARLHIGMTVQRAVEIMTAHGLDAQQYGFICYDQWDADTVQTGPDTFETHGTPGDRWGFRVDELLLFIARGFDARLAALEAKA